MEIITAIQKTPIPTILILAGLLFILLGFVTKLGGFIEVSTDQKRLAIPIGLLILVIGLVLVFSHPSNFPSSDLTISKNSEKEIPVQAVSQNIESSSTEDAGQANDCIPPYVWRLAVPSDHVCVSEESRKLVELENARADERRQKDGTGAYGPDTCVNGYVWREAFVGDTYCVLPERREEVRNENLLAASRTKSPSRRPIARQVMRPQAKWVIAR